MFVNSNGMGIYCMNKKHLNQIFEAYIDKF